MSDHIIDHKYYNRMLYYSSLFFFNDTATTEIYTLSLHDALPISQKFRPAEQDLRHLGSSCCSHGLALLDGIRHPRSEEHTSELQSHVNLVCRLLLEKKKSDQRVILRSLSCSGPHVGACMALGARA